MPSAPVSYRLDNAAAGRRVLDFVARRFDHQRQAGEPLSTTFYDSFDWRIFRQNSVLKAQFDGHSKVLYWVRADGSEGQRLPITDRPGFAWDLPVSSLREELETVLEMRRLQQLFTIESQAETLLILDVRRKTVARLQWERSKVHPAQGDRPSTDLPFVLRATPIRGYDKHFEALLRELANLNLEPLEVDEFVLAADLTGLQPGAYSRRLDLHLDPTWRSDVALKIILQRLFQVMQQNEEGLRANLDSEFLHDFRVSVRRTRSALTQLKGVLPPAVVARFKTEFSWLGQITGPTRDLDVYQLKMPEYRASLPEHLKSDLDPLNQFLELHQRNEHRDLVQLLGTQRYQTLLTEWRQFLDQPLGEDPLRPEGATPILDLASRRIWRSARKVFKKGGAIELDTPAEALHRLRIECKKLRYLLEFFRSLYPEDEILPLIDALKRLQDNLGDFNDLEVQQQTLKQFAQTMLVEKIGTGDSLMAMGRLVERLEKRQVEERQIFHRRFGQFSKTSNRKRFRKLFKPAEITVA